MIPPPLEVNDLYKTFYLGLFAPIPSAKKLKLGALNRVVEAVRGVDLRVEQGEVFGLLGANGAGKSTTIKSVMGLIKPTSGQVKLRGLPSSAPESREGVGYLPENPAFYDELTPQETLELLGALAGVPARERAKEAARQLARVGMSHAAQRPLRSLSKGMHQRVGIAQALLNQPQLIILDEPLSGLDPIGRREIREVLLEERARGASLMLSSHILPDVEALCDRFAVMHEGRVRHEAPMSSLWSHVSSVELSLGEVSEPLKSALLELEGARTHTSAEGLDQGAWGLTLPHTQQERALALIVEHQGTLRHLQPVRPTLDDLFERLARGEEVST